MSIDSGLRVVEWMIFNLKTKEIFDYHNEQLVKIVDIYFRIFVVSGTNFNR